MSNIDASAGRATERTRPLAGRRRVILHDYRTALDDGEGLTEALDARANACGGAEVQKVYAVAELVVPCNTPPARANDGCFLPCCAEAGLWTAQLAASSNTTEDKLIKLITSTVRPGCWAENGGRCTIEYFPIGLGLVDQCTHIDGFVKG